MENYKSFWDEIQEKYKIVITTFTPPPYASACMRVELELKDPEKRPLCDICNRRPNIHDYTKKEVTLGTLNGCPIVCCFKHCRYMCKKCNITFIEEFDWLPWHSGMTTDAKNYAISRLGSLTFIDISRDIGCSTQTISNIAREFGETERKSNLSKRYRFLSMDEIFVSRDADGKGQYYWVLNDLSTPWRANNIRIDKGRNKEDVIARLKELDHLNTVEAVCIDMWSQYRDAIHEVMPNAEVVVDPFHVIQLAHREFEKVRKGLSVDALTKAAMKKDAKLFLTSLFKLTDSELDRLEGYLQASPVLEKAYFIVQELSGLYRIKFYDDALEYLAKWETEVLSSGNPEMNSVLQTVQNWLPYIMNHFIFRISNGKTEGKNHMIRVIDKMGFHYGIDALQGCVYAHEQKQAYLKWLKHLKRKERKTSCAKQKEANSQPKRIAA